MQVDPVASGTLGALNAAVTKDYSPYCGLVFFFGNGLTGTVSFEASMDGTNWFPLAAVSFGSTTTTTAVTSVVNPTATTSAYVVEEARGCGLKWVRARVSAYTSGSCTGYLYPISD